MTKVREVSEQLTQVRRSDAVENRARLLRSARALFARDGLDVPMREIARDAGVGPATLYRHFPTKQLLATEAFAVEMHACRNIVARALADPSPWQGFCRLVEELCELHVQNCGFTEAFLTTFPDSVDLVAERRAALSAVADLARRAQADGDLHRDFVPEDLVLTLLATRGITGVRSARRLARLMIRGFRASPGS